MAFQICLHFLNALKKKNTVFTQRSEEAMIFFASYKKNCYISVFSVTKPKNFIVFAFTYVSESSALLNDDFCMNSHNVDSDEAMKRCSDEAMKWWSDEAMKRWSDEAMKLRSEAVKR